MYQAIKNKTDGQCLVSFQEILHKNNMKFDIYEEILDSITQT